ncbi:JmjC domain, hydroxylase-domain-containing protein [Globomyces pollinis-pini]|nr:JmjC domain, hydroxylase-domain-containing protein [Globomyces pollinis-pini]
MKIISFDYLSLMYTNIQKSNIHPTTLKSIRPAYYHEPNGVPVFKPTIEQFSDFYQFILAIQEFNTAGCIKVIPPRKWVKENVMCKHALNKISIVDPLIQTFSKVTSHPGAYILHQELNNNQSSYTFKQWQHQINLTHPLKETSTTQISNAQKSFDYTQGYHLSSLEHQYWNKLTSNATIYGAGIPGSLFPSNPKNTWNISKLQNYLTKVKKEFPGINTPFLYFGRFKSTFPWHLEDLDLYSINYIHKGQWYIVPPTHRKSFEKLADSLFDDEIKDRCPEYLRHKYCVVSPEILKEHGIPVHKVIHHENEFIITFPEAYHQGFNFGINVAESVNFGTDSWAKQGKKASYCQCSPNNISPSQIFIDSHLERKATAVGIVHHRKSGKTFEPKIGKIQPSADIVPLVQSKSPRRIKEGKRLTKRKSNVSQDDRHIISDDVSTNTEKGNLGDINSSTFFNTFPDLTLSLDFDQNISKQEHSIRECQRVLEKHSTLSKADLPHSAPEHTIPNIEDVLNQPVEFDHKNDVIDDSQTNNSDINRINFDTNPYNSLTGIFFMH